MPYAHNPQTGQVVEFVNGAWEPAREAFNPDTGERLHFVDGEWRSFGGAKEPLQPRAGIDPAQVGLNPDESGLTRMKPDTVDEMGLAPSLGAAAPPPPEPGQSVMQSAAKAVPRGAIETSALALEQPALSRRRSQTMLKGFTDRIQKAKEASPEEFTNLLRELAKAPVPAATKSELVNAAKDVRRGAIAARDVDFNIEGNVAESAMEGMRTFAGETFEIPEEHEKHLAVQVGRGIGSTTGFLATRLIPGGQLTLPAYAAAVGSGEAIERAAQNGADDPTQARASFMGVAPGMTDIVPIERLFKPLAPIFQKVAPEALESAKGAIYQVVASMVEQGVVEGTQEAIQQVMQNAIEQMTSRPEAEITEGIAENGLVGFLVGAIFGAGAGVGRAGRAGREKAELDEALAGIEQPVDVLKKAPVAQPGEADLQEDIANLVAQGELTPEEAELIVGEQTLTDEAMQAAERLQASADAAMTESMGIEEPPPLTPEQEAQAAADIEAAMQQGVVTPQEEIRAEEIRGDQVEAETPGQIGPPGEEISGEDIQRPAEARPEAGGPAQEEAVEAEPVKKKKKKRTKSDAARERYAKQRQIDPKADDLLAAIAKMGGMSRAEAEAAGIDPEEFGRRGWGVKHVFTKKGRTPEDLAQNLLEMGYPVTDEAGNYSENLMVTLVEEALRGKRLMAHAAQEAETEKQIEEHVEKIEQQLEDEEYDDNFLDEDRSLTDMVAWAVDQGADEAAIDQLVEDAVFEGKSSAEIEALVRKEVEAPTAGRPAPRAEMVEGEAPERAQAETEEAAKLKPLFVPLKTEYFEAFKKGEKTEEYRKLGARWNEQTAPVGRRITLSKGYGKKERIEGTVTGFRVVKSDDIPAALDLYGPGVDIAAIEVGFGKKAEALELKPPPAPKAEKPPAKEPKQQRVTPGIPRPSEFDTEASKRDRFELTPPTGKGAKPKRPLLEKAKQHAHGDRWPWEMTAQEFIERRNFKGKTLDEASDKEVETFVEGVITSLTDQVRADELRERRREADTDREFANELLMEDAAIAREMAQAGTLPVHARMIRDALKEGIEVQGEVLADFPGIEPGQADLAGAPEGEQVAKVRQEQVRQEQTRRDREAAEKAEAAEAEPPPPLVDKAQAEAAGQADIEAATDPADLPEPPTLGATQQRRAKLKREAAEIRKQLEAMEEEGPEDIGELTGVHAARERERLEKRLQALLAEDEYQKFRQEAFEQERAEAAKPTTKKKPARADEPVKWIKPYRGEVKQGTEVWTAELPNGVKASIFAGRIIGKRPEFYGINLDAPGANRLPFTSTHNTIAEAKSEVERVFRSGFIDELVAELKPPRTPGAAIPLDEISVTMNVEVEGQAGAVEMEVPANEALAILDKRIETLAKIRSCVLS